MSKKSRRRQQQAALEAQRKLDEQHRLAEQIQKKDDACLAAGIQASLDDQHEREAIEQSALNQALHNSTIEEEIMVDDEFMVENETAEPNDRRH